MTRAARILLTAACLGFAALAQSEAADAALGEYRIVSWQGGDGLTLGPVRTIVQDGDGYLWLASSVGLVRFDGLRFATRGLVAGRDLPSVTSETIFLSSDGSLWVGYSSGRGVYHIADGEVRGIYLEGTLAGAVHAVAIDRAGTLWVGHDQGLHRVIDGKAERAVVVSAADPDPAVYAVHEDRTGTLWLGTAAGLFRSTPSGTFERAPQSEGFIRAISEDATGRLWITDDTHGFRPADAPVHSGHTGRGYSLFHDRQGALWVATYGQGLWKVRYPGGNDAAPVIEVATVERGLLSNEMSGFLEDRDGNLWAGSNSGLHRLRRRKVAQLVDIGAVRGIAADADGTAWVGTTDGLIAVSDFRAGSAGHRRVISPLPVQTIHRAHDGTLWVATSQGVSHLLDGRLVPQASGGLPLTHVTSIASDRRGALWARDAERGLVRVAGTRLETATAITSGTTARPTLVRVDSADRLWVAFDDGTLRVLLRDGRIHQYDATDGLPHRRIFTLHEDAAGDIWVGGDRGLSRLRDGRVQTLTERHGLPDRPVVAILSDDAGDLWVGVSLLGFIRLDRRQLAHGFEDPSYRITYPIYNSAAGTAGSPLGDWFNAGAAKDHAGQLWFITARGLTILDPRALEHEPGARLGPPRIEGVTVDDRRYRAAGATTLTANVNRLLLDYAIINLSSFDQIRFRYRLDGFDGDWVDGTGRRQASYTNLPPGRYTFRLQAAGPAQPWDDESATTWSFTIPPAFHQTAWFYAVCSMVLVLAVAGTWRLRARHMRRQLAVVLNERIRLSREVHDTLLQSLVWAALQLDLASSEVERAPAEARAALVRARRQLEAYIREARQSIWTLRSPTLDRRDLAGALRNIGERMAPDGPRVALRVTGPARPCGAKVETQVLRIAQEAVANAVRHAQATDIDLHLDFSDRGLRLHVADNGRGFDPEAMTRVDGHYGIAGMRERAAEVGGRCTIESAPGTGARILVDIPLAS